MLERLTGPSISYALRFSGRAVELERGKLWAETRARSCVLVTVVGPAGIESRLEPVGGGEAVCRREITVHPDGSLSQTGEIDFGGASGITFSAEAGATVCEVTGGYGSLEGARGHITSQLRLSAAGELVDDHLGVLFVEATPLR